MLTTPTAHKSKNLWPSLSATDSHPAQSPTSGTSYFSDKLSGNTKLVHATGPKNMLMSKPRLPSQSSDDIAKSDIEDDLEELKVPLYKHSLGDALANALSNVHLNSGGKEATGDGGKGGKKKKAKKTLLFASGMSFGGM